MRTIYLTLLLVCLVVSFSTTLFSQNSLEGIFSYYYFDYTEEVPSPLKSAETAWLPGWKVIYTYQGTVASFYARGSYENTQAKTDYNGTTQNGEPLTLETMNNLKMGELDLGYTFQHIGRSQFSLTLYTGAAYRYWERRIGDTDPRGLREVYTWWNIPVGLVGSYGFGKSLRVSCDISVQCMFGGEIMFDFHASDPSYNNPTADLGSVVGWKMNFPIEFQVAEPFILEIGPWYEYSGIDQSNQVYITQDNTPVATYMEPASETSQVGVSMGIKMNF